MHTGFGQVIINDDFTTISNWKKFTTDASVSITNDSGTLQIHVDSGSKRGAETTSSYTLTKDVEYEIKYKYRTDSERSTQFQILAGGQTTQEHK